MTAETPTTPTQPALAAAAALEATPVPDNPADRVVWRPFWPSPKTVRHVVIEVFIVTVGVLLALGIDQMRQHFTRLAQAEEARQLLTAEMLENLAAVEEGMPRLAEAYKLLDAEPEKGPAIYDRGRFGTPLLVDAAYDLALQNGAMSYLGPEERRAISVIYREIDVYRETVAKYADAMRELASYATGSIDDRGEASARARQTRLAQKFATATFRSQCRLVVRLSLALGEPRTASNFSDYCGGITPVADVKAVIAGRYQPPATDAPPQTETQD